MKNGRGLHQKRAEHVRHRSCKRKSQHNKSLQLSAWVRLVEKECGPSNGRIAV